GKDLFNGNSLEDSLKRRWQFMKPIDIGSRRELFVDYLLIDKMKEASLSLHKPQPREVVLKHDKSWEGPLSLYHTLIKDGGRYLLFYRGWPESESGAVYCVAESTDGVNFERPNLGMNEYKGSKNNNILVAFAVGDLGL
ncbi:MAG: hypothetical protein ACLFV2_11960, partial [Desulfurivibrionaceae bacterium]